MKENRTLVPENDMQELWELSGRVNAVIAYLASATYPDRNTLIEMLGGDRNGVHLQNGIED